jgi:hypothetical protein
MSEIEKNRKLDLLYDIGFQIGINAYLYLNKSDMNKLIFSCIEKVTEDDDSLDAQKIYDSYAKKYFFRELKEL